MSSQNLQLKHMLSRWILIDELFMTSAQLLADIDRSLRGATQTASVYKKDKSGNARSFGGLNVLAVGDMYQLDPPEGLPLYTIPTTINALHNNQATSPSAEHGLHIMWGKTDLSFQGVTELSIPYRCRDIWYNEVLDQIRTLELSDDNHAFLHGNETTVPGSWVQGRPNCGNAKCTTLVDQWKDLAQKRIPWKTRQAMECEICAQERKSKRRVLTTEEFQQTFAQKSMINVICAVPNNDVRYEINKHRATLFAQLNNKQLLWCPAKDKVSLDALRDDPSLPSRKLEWLQRHDRQSGDLMGMLPLVLGLRVMLTDHIDRAKHLFRGRTGTIASWQLHDNDAKKQTAGPTYILQSIPQIVFVIFDNADWTLDGSTIPGLYPICPTSRNWYLDQARKYPKLRITRSQLPLAPAYAFSIHSLQGDNPEMLAADCCISETTSRQTCYVALSRAKLRESIFLMRPFPQEMFKRNPPLGPPLLLRQLKGPV